MKKVQFAAVVVLLFGGILCLGANPSFSPPTSAKKDVLQRLEELEKQNAALTQQVNELKVKVEVLTDRVNALAAALPGGGGAPVARSGSPGPTSAGPPSVPGGLEVVRLTPGANTPQGPPPNQPPANQPKGRVIVVNNNPGSPSATNPTTGAPLPGTNYVPLPDPAGSPPPSAGAPANKPSVSTSPPAMASPPPAAPVKDEPTLFNEIKKLVQENRRSEAVPLMETYLKQYPKGPHVDAVAYWLGEEKFSRGDYEGAIKVYRLVTENYPGSNYAPDALYKIGLALLELNRKSEAAEVLEEVKILYPFSEAAQKAEKKLASCCRER